MNKEKQIIDTIQHKAWGVNKTTRPVYGQGQYDMAYEILEEVQKIIQSEPEETCDGCIHEKEPVDTYPCKHCKRAYTDGYKKAGE